MKEWNQFSKELGAIDEIERQAIKQTAHIVSELVRRREALGWTQRELADRSGLKQSAIARLESSPTIPRLDTIQKVATALGLQFSLIGIEEAAGFAYN